METKQQTGAKARITLLLFTALLIVPLYALFLTGLASAASLEAGTRLGASGGAGYYTLEKYDVSFSTLTINSSEINITGLSSGSDVFNVSDGVLYYQDVTEAILPSTATDETIRIGDLISNTSAITITNMTGNFTHATVCYTSTGVGNITVNLDNVSGACWYTADLKRWVRMPRSASSFSNCTLTYTTNATAGSYCVSFSPDPSLNATELSGIVAAAAVAITGVIIATGWTTRSD